MGKSVGGKELGHWGGRRGESHPRLGVGTSGVRCYVSEAQMFLPFPPKGPDDLLKTAQGNRKKNNNLPPPSFRKGKTEKKKGGRQKRTCQPEISKTPKRKKKKK